MCSYQIHRILNTKTFSLGGFINKIIVNMRDIKRARIAALAAAAGAVLLGLSAAAAYASSGPALTASVTASNTTTGTNDQTDAMASTTANVAEVKAQRILLVATAPLTTNTITIGTCTVTFATTTGGVNSTQDLDCSGDSAVRITTATTSVDTAKTAAQIATDLSNIKNATSTGHGAITAAIGTTTTKVTFTTTNTEASATSINFTDGTSGKITSVGNTTGVIPVVQVNTISIGGTIEAGDTFSVVLPGPVTASYVSTSNDTSSSTVATGLNAAIQASAGYSSQAFTSAASFGTVVLTAKTAGTGFIPNTPTATNRSAVAQVVVFTPTVFSGNKYTVTINGVDYTYTLQQSSLSTLLSGLASAITSTDPSCSQNGTVLTCTAATPGTGFTYSSSVSSSHTGGGGGGGRVSGGGSSHTTKPATPATPATPAVPGVSPAMPATPATPAMPAMGGSFTHGLHLGLSGDEVAHLQTVLESQGFLVMPQGIAKGFFGGLTTKAVGAFQVKYGIAKPGDEGYGNVGPKTRAQLNALGL